MNKKVENKLKVTGNKMALKEIINKASKELADLTGFRSPRGIGAKKDGNAWIISVEVLEKTSIPDGMDLLGTYEVKMDEKGDILGYERVDLRKRADTTLQKEV